jgi:hypothetical protein
VCGFQPPCFYDFTFSFAYVDMKRVRYYIFVRHVLTIANPVLYCPQLRNSRMGEVKGMQMGMV